MKMYEYLVAYKFSAKGYFPSCDGTMTIFRRKKIKSCEDLNDVKKFIEENINMEGVSNVSIYNLVLLGRNKH
jgi:hypothetical protein